MSRIKVTSEKRQNDMQQIAYENDMSYVKEDEWGLLNFLEGFKLFKKGIRKKIYNLVQKKGDFLEEQFHIFDYQYVISSGKSRKVYNQTVFFIQSKSLGLPEFLMKPENFFHKIGSYLGMQDIDFETHEKFSNQYLLKGEDEELIRDMMTDEILYFFTVEKHWHLEGVGYFLVLYKKNKVLNTPTIRKFYKRGMKLYEMLKMDQ